MKIQYFPEVDIFIIELTTKPTVATDAISEDIIIDYDDAAKVVAITLANYSKNTETIDIYALGITCSAAQLATEDLC